MPRKDYFEPKMNEIRHWCCYCCEVMLWVPKKGTSIAVKRRKFKRDDEMKEIKKIIIKKNPAGRTKTLLDMLR